jgi:hypothetical protein
MTNKFLQGNDGNFSNSRLIADIMIVSALLMVFSFIVIGVFKPSIDLMAIATAIGVLFGSVAGTAMTFLFFQKKTEAETKKPEDNPIPPTP